MIDIKNFLHSLKGNLKLLLFFSFVGGILGLVLIQLNLISIESKTLIRSISGAELMSSSNPYSLYYSKLTPEGPLYDGAKSLETLAFNELEGLLTSRDFLEKFHSEQFSTNDPKKFYNFQKKLKIYVSKNLPLKGTAYTISYKSNDSKAGEKLLNKFIHKIEKRINEKIVKLIDQTVVRQEKKISDLKNMLKSSKKGTAFNSILSKKLKSNNKTEITLVGSSNLALKLDLNEEEVKKLLADIWVVGEDLEIEYIELLERQITKKREKDPSFLKVVNKPYSEYTDVKKLKVSIVLIMILIGLIGAITFIYIFKYDE